MRLRAINVFSAYIGDSEETRRRTGLLRKDSDFLYVEYYNVVIPLAQPVKVPDYGT